MATLTTCDLRDIAKEIGDEAKSIAKISLPNRQGVYGIFANKAGCLSAIQFKRTDFLYLGKSTNLADRGHFETGKTSNSTLRRTLGALLKQELSLHAYARGAGHTPKDFTNYRFDGKGEEKLTEWMKANLRIGFFILIDDLDATEERLIEYCKPILNLTLQSTLQIKKIKALRKICADESRSNGPLRNR